MVVMLMTTMVLLTIMMAVPVAVLAQAGSPRATLLIERLPADGCLRAPGVVLQCTRAARPSTISFLILCFLT